MIIKRLRHNEDLICEITGLCRKKKIKAGWFSVIGALKNLVYGYYDQKKRKYIKLKFNKECEILSCTGNISLLEGEVFVHAHIDFAGADGKSSGGHLFEGKIFAAEIMILPCRKNLKRQYDRITGLNLW